MTKRNRLEPPDIPSYYQLWAGRLDKEEQRNILLNFIDEKGLNDEFVKYLNEHFPYNEYGYREERNEE